MLCSVAICHDIRHGLRLFGNDLKKSRLVLIDWEIGLYWSIHQSSLSLVNNDRWRVYCIAKATPSGDITYQFREGTLENGRANSPHFISFFTPSSSPIYLGISYHSVPQCIFVTRFLLANAKAHAVSVGYSLFGTLSFTSPTPYQPRPEHLNCQRQILRWGFSESFRRIVHVTTHHELFGGHLYQILSKPRLSLSAAC